MTMSPFPSNGRYAASSKLIYQLPGQGEVAYLSRRWVPPSGRFQELQRYTVAAGERLDQITARFLNDPEQFWRICDANDALSPGELEVPGRSLRITMPEGLPGVPLA